MASLKPGMYRCILYHALRSCWPSFGSSLVCIKAAISTPMAVEGFPLELRHFSVLCTKWKHLSSSPPLYSVTGVSERSQGSFLPRYVYMTVPPLYTDTLPQVIPDQREKTTTHNTGPQRGLAPSPSPPPPPPLRSLEHEARRT